MPKKTQTTIDVVVIDFAHPPEGFPRLCSDDPERQDPDEERWVCDFAIADLYKALTERGVVSTPILCCGLIHYDGSGELIQASEAQHLDRVAECEIVKTLPGTYQGPSLEQVGEVLLLDRGYMVPWRLLLVEKGAEKELCVKSCLEGLGQQGYKVNMHPVD